MCATPRTIAFLFQLILLFVLCCSFLTQYCLMIMEEEEPKEDHFATLLKFPVVPKGFPEKTSDVCFPPKDEEHNIVNLIASMNGFLPIVRIGIIFITLTGLLYYLVELTYLPFILVALDLLATTLSTIFYIYKYNNYIFHNQDCIIPASLRVFESMVVLINFILLAFACLYIVNLYQCRVIVESSKKNKKNYSFVLGSKNDLKRINKIVGYETRRARKSHSRKSGKSIGSKDSSIKSRSSKRSQSRSISSRSTRSDNSRSDPIANSTRSTTLSKYP